MAPLTHGSRMLLSTTAPSVRPTASSRRPLQQTASPDPEVRERVLSLLAALYPAGKGGERRGERRYPYPQLVQLTPVADDGETPVGSAIIVAGKHLSERGLGFFHREPVPHRRMIATLEQPGGVTINFLIDISWCRFTRHGWYESGGRFLQVSSLPRTGSVV